MPNLNNDRITLNMCRRLNRDYITATPLKSGKILLVGGRIIASYGSYCDDSILFDPQTNEFVNSGRLVYGKRYAHSAIKLANGNVLIVGGLNARGLSTNTCEIYNHISQTFSACAPLLVDRYLGELFPFSKGRILVVGGSSNVGMNVPLDEVYNFKIDQWVRRDSIIEQFANVHIICRGCGSKHNWIVGTSKKNYLCIPCRGI